MSKQTLQEILAAMDRVRTANSTPEKAREFLKQEGFLKPDGTVAQPYAQLFEKRS
jgi:hypothetical protein